MGARKVLTVAAAVVCLAVSFLVGTGSSATATQGQAVIAGTDNSETSSTTFCNVTSGSCGGTNGGIKALTDKSGGVGVEAFGDGTNGIGVEGDGSASGGTGVLGVSATYGVHGQASYVSNSGWGVWGEGNDRGVYGISNNEGVVGFGNNVGVRADSPGIALRVTGKVELSRSGLATINGTSTTPLSSIVVSNVSLSAKSMVIATVQKSVGVWVKAAVPNVAGSSVTIYLNKAATKSVPVAWMVIESP